MISLEEALNSESGSFGNESSSGSAEVAADPLSLLLSSMAPRNQAQDSALGKKF
jgi:hypothetical protein